MNRFSRYFIAFYCSSGWQIYSTFNLHTTPESALEEFLRNYGKLDKDSFDYPKYYKVIEIDLEIPIITNE